MPPHTCYIPFSDNPAQTIASLGEIRLIKAIQGWLGKWSPPPPLGIGDDCAVLPVSARRQLITVDPVVYNEHFNDSISPADTGRKLFHRNLSDIASMGGRPRAAVIALALESRVRIDWLARFYRSIAAVSKHYRVPLVGGDITRLAHGIVATLTLIGEADSTRVLTRSGAKAGDHIYVTGTLGGSILGKHCRFVPRLQEAAWLVKNPQVHSMTDISDGLAKDLLSLKPAGSRIMLYPSKIPISTAARQLTRKDSIPVLQHALGDGEDYELLFSLSRKADTETFERAWKQRFNVRLTRIGFFQKAGMAKASRDAAVDFLSLNCHGYEHFGQA